MLASDLGQPIPILNGTDASSRGSNLSSAFFIRLYLLEIFIFIVTYRDFISSRAFLFPPFYCLSIAPEINHRLSVISRLSAIDCTTVSVLNAYAISLWSVGKGDFSRISRCVMETLRQSSPKLREYLWFGHI